MQRLYNLASTARNILLCQSGSKTTLAASKMDPALRSALVEIIQPDAVDCEGDLDSIEKELESAKKALKEAVEKEQFLGVRSRQYRKRLDARTYELQQERKAIDVDDEEGGALAAWESHMKKLEKDEEALQQVVETQTQILSNIVQIRRTMKELNKKKSALVTMNQENQDFLTVEKGKNTMGSIDLPLHSHTAESEEATFGTDALVDTSVETNQISDSGVANSDEDIPNGNAALDTASTSSDQPVQTQETASNDDSVPISTVGIDSDDSPSLATNQTDGENAASEESHPATN